MLAGQKQQHPALTAVEGLMLRSGKPLRCHSILCGGLKCRPTNNTKG